MKTWRAANESSSALLKLDLSVKQGHVRVWGLWGHLHRLRPRTQRWRERRDFHPIFLQSREGQSSCSAPLGIPHSPFLTFCFLLLNFFLFGSNNDSGYLTTSSFGPWNTFAFQRARKSPRITKRQVRTMTFRKQPYHSA